MMFENIFEEKKINKEKLCELINMAIDKAISTIAPYVNEWEDSSFDKRERDIQDLKQMFKDNIKVD